MSVSGVMIALILSMVSCAQTDIDEVTTNAGETTDAPKAAYTDMSGYEFIVNVRGENTGNVFFLRARISRRMNRPESRSTMRSMNATV